MTHPDASRDARSLADGSTVPAPQSVAVDGGALRLSPELRIAGPSPSAELLRDAVAQRTGIRLAIVDDDADIRLTTDANAHDAEGYALSIGERIELVGADDAGLFYGTQTLIQLLSGSGEEWHLHLTDDQGWRIQIDSWPLLTARAAGGGADPGEAAGSCCHPPMSCIST